MNHLQRSRLIKYKFRRKKGRVSEFDLCYNKIINYCDKALYIDSFRFKTDGNYEIMFFRKSYF